MINMKVVFTILFTLFSNTFADPTVYFKEEFGADYESRWIESQHKETEQGKFVHSAGKYYHDPESDKGIKTSQDARFYAIAAKFVHPFSNEKKTLVVQFQVKHEQNIDCGGGYLKILRGDFNPLHFHGETPYSIMFGPDICGYTKKVHVIFNYNGNNHLIKKDIRCKDDELSHLYTLIVNSDNTYEVLIDNEKVESGLLESDWDFLAPKKIPDPTASKPEDWDDNEFIDDENDTKPEDYDKPKTIIDPKAKKPDDWDDDMDGEWEAPQIDNPEYKGEWKPKQLPNPKYKGAWIHPEIDNPDYAPDPNLYIQKDMSAVGFDLWQVKSGTIFDNILITDDADYAKFYGEETWRKLAEAEKKIKEEDDEKAKKEEEKVKKDQEKYDKTSLPEDFKDDKLEEDVRDEEKDSVENENNAEEDPEEDETDAQDKEKEAKHIEL